MTGGARCTALSKQKYTSGLEIKRLFTDNECKQPPLAIVVLKPLATRNDIAHFQIIILLCISINGRGFVPERGHSYAPFDSCTQYNQQYPTS